MAIRDVRVTLEVLAEDGRDLEILKAMAEAMQVIDGTTGDISGVQADLLCSAYDLAHMVAVADLVKGRDPRRVAELVELVHEADGTSGDLTTEQAKWVRQAYESSHEDLQDLHDWLAGLGFITGGA